MLVGAPSAALPLGGVSSCLERSTAQTSLCSAEPSGAHRGLAARVCRYSQYSSLVGASGYIDLPRLLPDGGKDRRRAAKHYAAAKAKEKTAAVTQRTQMLSLPAWQQGSTRSTSRQQSDDPAGVKCVSWWFRLCTAQQPCFLSSALRVSYMSFGLALPLAGSMIWMIHAPDRQPCGVNALCGHPPCSSLR